MKLLTPVLLLLALSGCSGEVVDDFTKTCPEFFANPKKTLSPPTVFPGPNYKQICQVRENTYEYTTLYNTSNRIPVYSAYRFIGLKHCDRKGIKWFIEPQLEDRLNGKDMVDEKEMKTPILHQATDKDYEKSGYHRGHLAPVYHATSQECSDATFTLTNAAPQVGPSFNGGKWMKVEMDVAKFLEKNCLPNPAYIVTGVVPGFKTLHDKTPNGVNIPRHFWTAYCCLDNNLKPIRSGGYLGENRVYDTKEDPLKEMSVTKLEDDLKNLYGRVFRIFGGKCN